LGGMKTPGALVEASVSDVPRVNVPVCAVNGVRATPSVSVPVCVVKSVIPVCAVTSVVPVCVVSRCVFTSVWKCVLRRTHTGSKRACVKATSCANEPPCASVPSCEEETPSVEETPCASGVVASVPECVLPGTPCVKGAPQAEEAAGAPETARSMSETPRVSAPAGVVCVCEARVSERPCVRTACVRSLYTREMSVAMREHAAASPGARVNGNAIECSLGVLTRRSVWREWRRRLRLWRDKCRVAAVVPIGTGPGLHGSARVVRAVPRTRPPRARLRG